MEPKEKAKELVDKFRKYVDTDFAFEYSKEAETHHAKQCALIAVDDILNIENVKPYILHKEIINYYTKVKEEINKL